MHDSSDASRRQALIAATAVGAALLAPAIGRAEPAATSVAPEPLPFDPTKLRGLSERLLRSHHENNYGGAVRKLGGVRAQLAALDDDAPGFVRGGLQRSELILRNSVALHEAYFGNLGGDGNAAGQIKKALAEAWGSFGAWEEEFRRTAMTLAGGSGWALLALDLGGGDLAVIRGEDHSQSLSAGIPLLALDMYEHSYHMDFGAAAARYVEAFMDNVDWEVVDRRHQAARKAFEALGAA